MSRREDDRKGRRERMGEGEEGKVVRMEEKLLYRE